MSALDCPDDIRNADEAEMALKTAISAADTRQRETSTVQGNPEQNSTTAPSIPVIDVSALLHERDPAAARAVIRKLDVACAEVGFFMVENHGIDTALLSKLEGLSRSFFALPEEEKAEIAMSKGGSAWRGWFPLGDEFTSGLRDGKAGIYFGSETEPGLPLHGRNLFPERPAELRAVVTEYMRQAVGLARVLMRGIAEALGLAPSYFEDAGITSDPTVGLH